jgi:2-isopropylmalate synthase
MPQPAPFHGEQLVFDWNEADGQALPIPPNVEVLDETFRDGLQNPSVTVPRLERKIEMLHLMDQVGVDYVVTGVPAASGRAFEDCLALCRAVRDDRLRIRVACAGRTMLRDVTPIIELSQRVGIPITAYVFVGTSPIRALAEDWDLERIKRFSSHALDATVGAGLQTTYVTEDTTRSRPEVLGELFRLAVDRGANRLCLCDTVGHATPRGVGNLVRFTRATIDELGANVGIDWHGHNDRGMALINALTALEAGADRVHATALGIGERVGNTPMELLLLNLELLGVSARKDTSHLFAYCRTAARALGWQIPANYPLVGRDAFRTATGVHAAAIMKAEAKGDAWLADRIYSSVPAGTFGRRQEICVGQMSGASNVVYWLKSRGIEPDERLVRTILDKAKEADHILSEEELLGLVKASAFAEQRSVP